MTRHRTTKATTHAREALKRTARGEVREAELVAAFERLDRMSPDALAEFALDPRNEALVDAWLEAGMVPDSPVDNPAQESAGPSSPLEAYMAEQERQAAQRRAHEREALERRAAEIALRPPIEKVRRPRTGQRVRKRNAEQLQAVEDLRTLARELREVKLRTRRAVDEARRLGVMWSDVGDALGVPAETARNRWGRKTV